MQKHTGDIHQPSNTVHHRASLCTSLADSRKKKRLLCLREVQCDNVIPCLCLCWYPRCRTSKKRKINFSATNKMQEKAVRKAEEAHFSYITPHKRFTLTNAEVDRRDPIIIRLPAVGSLSGCCIFPSQMLTRPTSTAQRIAKCQSFPQPLPP